MLKNKLQIHYVLLAIIVYAALASAMGCGGGCLMVNQNPTEDPRFEGEFKKVYESDNSEITLVVGHQAAIPDDCNPENGKVFFNLLQTGAVVHSAFGWEMLQGSFTIREMGRAAGILTIEFQEGSDGQRITENCDAILELMLADEGSACPSQIRLSCDENDVAHNRYVFTLDRQTTCH